MSKLIRKVTLAKWKGDGASSLQKIPADAITVDLKTTGNTLSFWLSDDATNEDAMLALLGTLQRIETIDVVSVDAAKFDGLKIVASPGGTVFDNLNDLHRDVAELDHNQLFGAASILGEKIFSDDVKRVTKGEFRRIFQGAVDAGKISWENVPESMQKDLKAPAA